MLFGIARRLVEPDRFAFLDEPGAGTDMTRLHGRRTGGVVRDASLVGPGAMSGELFLEWVRTRLCPTPGEGDVRRREAAWW